MTLTRKGVVAARGVVRIKKTGEVIGRQLSQCYKNGPWAVVPMAPPSGDICRGTRQLTIAALIDR